MAAKKKNKQANAAVAAAGTLEKKESNKEASGRK
jgi:hypothetical protein